MKRRMRNVWTMLLPGLGVLVAAVVFDSVAAVAAVVASDVGYYCC